MNLKLLRPAAGLLLALFAPAANDQTNPATARPELLYVGRGNFSNSLARPLRYTPQGTDFVITNGAEFFNRPLYGVNNSFRADGGDKPEFSLYLPGRGGNLRLGLKTAAGVKWLNDADKIVARYRPGSMVYEIKDALLTDSRELHLTVLPLSAARGIIVRAEINSARKPIELVFAFGGANGMKGRRGGDIGCEREPVAQFFQLAPEQCAGSEIFLATNSFTLRGKGGTIFGATWVSAELAIGDANFWAQPGKLLAGLERRAPSRPVVGTDSQRAETVLGAPLVIGHILLPNEQPVYLALQQTDDDAQKISAEDLPKLFSAAEEHRRTIAERVVVETPDAFINAAAGALNIAADAVWDSQSQSFMHGAVAWRMRLLGWRGPYAGDALGWHERTAAHFAGFARGQNTNPIPEKIPAADEQFNLARSEAAIHSNGDMSKNHYDMNLVAVDAFFRHLLWTGDLDYARAQWPVIERHLTWERRLFRREFGDDKLPLYEAYAAIWASDDLNYNGGGTTHASAYNYFANKMAARVAKLLGKDGTFYEHEADLILRGMRKYLWLANEGNFAECKDYLGLQLVHPNSGLWTFYHTLDSEVPTAEQALQMANWIENNIARIPVQIENYYTLPETSWLPYQWSLNNVVVAEAVHTSLGFWQAGRRDAAFALFKGSLLDTMFLGLCPGNVGAMTHYDMARGEAQRDFADGIGVTARALVEGLFGVKPDALAGELKIIPGFPADWTNSSIKHPDFNFSFHRDGVKETFVIEPKFKTQLSLRLQIPALRDGVASVKVNGASAKWIWLTNLPGEPRVEILAEATVRSEVVVTWKGNAFPLTPALSLGEREKRSQRLGEINVASDLMASGSKDFQKSGRKQLLFPLPGGEGLGEGKAFDWNQKLSVSAKLETIPLATVFNDRVTQIFRNEYRTPRSPFVSLAAPKQGIGGWCEPNASFNVDDSGLRALAAKSDGKIILPNGVPFATPGAGDAKNVAFVSQWDNYPREISVPLAGKSSRAFLLMSGSTCALQSRMDNGEVIVTYADGTTARLALRNPETWWPIDQDYFTDDYAFRLDAPLPPRVDLQTGKIRVLDAATFKGTGKKIPGGAATVLELPLEATKELESLTIRALANEVVIGLMSVTLVK